MDSEESERAIDLAQERRSERLGQERVGGLGTAALAMERRRTVSIFVDTSLRTRFVCQAPSNLTFGELREALKRDHQWCYPNMGEVGLHFVMVEVNSFQYRVTDAAVVGGLFHGDEGFLKLDMEIVEHMGSPAECGDALALDSQQLPRQINLLENATGKLAEDALAADARGSVEGLTTSNLLRDSKADKGKVDSEKPMDLTKVGSKGKLQNAELGVAKLKRKGPGAIQKENDLVNLKSRDNESSQMIELRVAGEGSILNALNGFGAAHAVGRNSRKLPGCENSEERVALSGKMLSEANFVTRGSLMNVDNSLDLQAEENKESDAKENVLTHETEGNANTQSQGNELKSKKKGSYGRHKAVRDPSNNSDAMNAGSEGTTKQKRKTFVATGIEKPIYPEEILGGDIKSSKDHAINSSEKPMPPKPARIRPNQSERPIIPMPARISSKFEIPCPAGCGKVYSGKTSAWYQHRKTCKGL